jgi:hypothetical protein
MRHWITPTIGFGLGIIFGATLMLNYAVTMLSLPHGHTYKEVLVALIIGDKS